MSKFSQTNYIKAHGENSPSDFCQVEIFFLIILFFIWRFDCTDLMSKILSSSNHMNLATLDALHGKGLT